MQDVRPERIAEVLQTVAAPTEFSPIKSEQWKLNNGLTVYFYQDPELPLVQGSLVIRGGTIWEPAERSGAISAMGSQLRLGGAGRWSADEMDLELEKLAATISTSFGEEYGSVSFQSLAADFSTVLGMVADVVQRPRFESDRFNLWKGQAIESIRRRKDDPTTIAAVSFGQLLYQGTPYSRVVTSDDVKKLTIEDMIEMQRQFVRPDEAIMVITGNVTRGEVEQRIAEQFAEWDARGSVLSSPPAISHEAERAIYFVPGDFQQATIYMGHLGVPRLTEDHHALEAFNYVFGTGGFSSRLMQSVRSAAGLAYVVYGGVFPGVAKGKNAIVVQTRADATPRAIETSVGVLRTLQETPVQAEELLESKRALQNSFVFKFDSISEMVQREATLKMLGYPDNYDAQYLHNIEMLSAEDLRAAASRRWKLGNFVVVVVGNETAYTALQQAINGASPFFENMKLHRASFQEKLRTNL